MTPTPTTPTIPQQTLDYLQGQADTHGMTPDEMILSGLAAYSAFAKDDVLPGPPTRHAYNARLARALSMLAHHLGHPLTGERPIATNDTTGSVSVLIDGDERVVIPAGWEPTPDQYGTAREG